MTRSNRRDFCRTLLGGTVGLSLAARSPELFGQNASISVTKLTDNLSLISGAGANVVLLNGPDGALMVNGGEAERSAELLKVVSEQTGGKPVQVLFNTDWHLENTGSNDTLGSSGAKIIAHENTKLWMNTEFHVQWQNRTYKPRAKKALPNETFYTTGKMAFGKEEIQYGYLGQAHTDGDIYVFFPGPNILVTGDLFTVGKYPILDWSTGGWIGARGLPPKPPATFVGTRADTAFLNLSNEQTRVIPGSGPVQTYADLKELANMMETVRARFYDYIGKGMTPADMYRAAPTKEFDAKWGDPKQFVANVYPGLWNHVRELGFEAHGIV
jgi:glyoxylase-like metal-dependent hydrolase (beta-lactamase superfamily II)